MPANRRKVAVTAPYDRWVLLGKLLAGRRQILGYTHRYPGFEADSGVNRRMQADFELAAKDRVNHFMPGSFQLVAHGYQVTERSMLAVLRGDADELAPAAPAALPVPDEPPGWLADDAERSAADRPYRDEIMGRLKLLRLQGKAPSGEQLFGKGTTDAEYWDKYAGDWEERDVVWFVADLQRRAAGRVPPDSGEGTGA
jgi:hypothetical protein